MSNLEKNFISAVVYAHNEEKIIESFLNNIISTLRNNFDNFEIIVVDDCSTDHTVDEVKKVKKANSNNSISVIHMSTYQGREDGMVAGVDLSIGDFVYEFDKCLLEINEKHIMDCYYRCLSGNDIVFVSPNRKSSFLARCFYSIFNMSSGYAYKISTDSFKIVSRRGINRIHSLYKKIPYRKAVYVNCGLKSDVMLYETKDKKYRYSKEEKQNNIKVGYVSLMLFTDVAFKVSVCITLLMMLFSFGMIIYVLYDLITLKQIVSGWASLMTFMAISFFALFLLLSIILRYLSLNINMNFKNRKYLIESIEKL